LVNLIEAAERQPSNPFTDDELRGIGVGPLGDGFIADGTCSSRRRCIWADSSTARTRSPSTSPAGARCAFLFAFSC
jgi:hypothetical protein